MTAATMTYTSPNTLYQPHQFTHPFSKRPDLESINELSRVSTGSTQYSHTSDIYMEPEHDTKIQLNFTPKEIELVRSTWKVMLSDDLNKNSSEAASSVSYTSMASSLFCIQFYSNLLAMDTNLEKLFPSIKHQAVSFAGVLSTAILNLETLEVLDDYLMKLGKRHARILGIDPPHFELMGVALLKTFRDRFGPVGFNLELERSWARLYTYLANSILQFGIDPVLRNEKINGDIPNSTQRNSSVATIVGSPIESLNKSLTPSGRTPSISSNSSTSSGSTLINTPSTAPTKSSSLASASKFTKRASKMGKSLTSTNDQEEKCVIM